MGKLSSWWKRVTGQTDTANMVEQFEKLQAEYAKYTGATEGMFGKSPQIDLSSFMDSIGGYQQNMMDSAQGYASGVMGAYNKASSNVGRYQSDMTGQSKSMLDEYLKSAGQVEGYSQKGLKGALGSFDEYLGGYKSMASADMPGMDVYRGQIGANTATSIDRLKSMGGGSSSNIASILNNQADQMRGLAVESSQYKAQRKQDLANAYMTHGQATQGAYNSAIGSTGMAANMRGAGRQGMINTAQTNAGLSMGLGEMGIGANRSAYDIIGNAYSNSANMQNMMAGMEQSQFQFNEYNPYMTEMMWNQQQAMSNNPFQSGMHMYGDMATQQRANFASYMKMITDLGGTAAKSLVGSGG